MLKFIEFVCHEQENISLLTIELNAILGFKYLNEKNSILFMKEGREFNVIGNHRTLMNRLMYVLNLKKDTSYDYIARPSSAIFNNFNQLCIDNTFFEYHQLYSFIKLLNSNLLTHDYFVDMFKVEDINYKEKNISEIELDSQKTKKKITKFKKKIDDKKDSG